MIEEKEFREFVIKINLSQQYMKSFEKAVQSIKTKRKQLYSLSKQKEITLIKSDIDSTIKTCKEIQKSIKELILANEPFIKATKSEDKHYTRLVTNMYSSCLKKFERVTDFFSSEQTLMSDYLKQTIIREAEIALNRKLDESEITRFIDDPSLIQTMMSNKLEGQAHTELVNKVSDLELRHNDIVNLEKNINEIYQLFVDLQELVRNQGQIIENIEENISSAKDCTLNAEVDILQSYDYLKSARKKKCIVIVIVVVIMIIIISIVLPLKL